MISRSGRLKGKNAERVVGGGQEKGGRGEGRGEKGREGEMGTLSQHTYERRIIIFAAESSHTCTRVCDKQLTFKHKLR